MGNSPIGQVSEYWRNRYHKTFNLTRWKPYSFITEAGNIISPKHTPEYRNAAEETAKLITHWMKGSPC